MEQVATRRDPCYFELALPDQSIEQRAQRGRPELIPKDPHVAVIARVEPASANSAHRPLRRERLLLIGEVVDAGIQNLRQLFPLMRWNIAEGCHEASTVRGKSDITRSSNDMARHFQ